MMNDEEITSHFKGSLDGIPQEEKSSFYGLAEIIHSLELDWWQVGVDREFARFGRLDTRGQKAKYMLGKVIRTGNSLTIYINHFQQKQRITGITPVINGPLTNVLVKEIGKQLQASKNEWPVLLKLNVGRIGYWPENHVPNPGDPSSAAQAPSQPK